MFFVDITSTHLTFYDSYFALFFFIAHITLGNSVFYLSILLWRRKWQPTPALLPGKSHGWRSLIGYTPWGHKQSDTTERLQTQIQIQYVTLMLIYFLCQFSSVVQSCLTLCNLMDCSMPGLPVHRQLPEFTQTRVH